MNELKMEEKLADYVNDRTYWMYYNMLHNYALSMFEWTGLPDTVDERFLELIMYEEGKILFFKDNTYGFMALPFAYGGKLNMYRNPTEYQAISIEYNKHYGQDEAVPIWNNYARTPIYPIIEQYAWRLYEITRTADINIHAQKMPILVLMEETQRLTMENAYKRYKGNHPFIFGNKKGFDKDAVDVFKTDAPYVADKLQIYKNEIWNEAMTFLGIGNSKQDKKERLVADEVQANDEQIQQSRDIMLDARRQAVKKINDKWKLDISVDFKLNQQQSENNGIIESKGGDES